ncbi:DUF3231 family protein [Bacillus sp. BRMEA1]|uniref:DUF3231 family protein n=1 Tax=Neobacillus endophyticus TaxID=2738405 RepID=UPI001567656F|nr:DUF3231 family protein [Neobacillus endophyticus]NRD79725.1 DUF3231 family protein [Neobacillus endophyticus]
MDVKNNAKLTSGELAYCWEQLMDNSASNLVLEYFNLTSELQEVKSLCSEAGSISKSTIQFCESVLSNENYPMPKGFNINYDLNPNAPKMYTDVFILFYLNNLSKLGISLSSMALTDSVREDIRNFFHEQLKKMSDLFQRTTTTLLEKGVFVRPPSITSTHETSPIANKGFLGNFFNENRELTAREANELHKNVFMNYIGKNLLIGFMQTTSNPQLKAVMQHGKELALNIIDKLGDILIQNDLPISMTWDTCVLDGETAPFSDKLMTYLLDQMNRDGIANYGYSAAVSVRKDLKVTYAKIITDVYQYEENIKSFMLKNEWMEKPPVALNRIKLAEDKV